MIRYFCGVLLVVCILGYYIFRYQFAFLLLIYSHGISDTSELSPQNVDSKYLYVEHKHYLRKWCRSLEPVTFALKKIINTMFATIFFRPHILHDLLSFHLITLYLLLVISPH